MSNPYEDYQPPAGGGVYQKFNDGDSFTFRIAGEPVVYESIFEKEGEETKISTRYAWKAWNFDTNEAVILQLGITGYKDIAALAVDADWGDPTKYNITIKRTGTALNTKYSITPKPNRDELPADTVEALADIDLKEKIAAGKGVQHVFLLSEAAAQGPKA